MQWTHEHEEIRKTLKRYIDEQINPYVDEWEAAEIFPAHQVFKGLGDLGLLGLTKPEEYGGMGLDYSYSVLMAETLGHIHCGGVPMAIGVQTDMCTPALARYGSDELRREFVELLDGLPPEQAILQCGSGVSACLNLLAMERAGLPGAKLYPGSWSEWCSDPARPVER